MDGRWVLCGLAEGSHSAGRQRKDIDMKLGERMNNAVWKNHQRYSKRSSVKHTYGQYQHIKQLTQH
jgi:hypothetical protein